jgi:DnaJ-class molecular chaperone
MPGDNRMRDPYTVLGVSRSADQNEIKTAWRMMAKKLHPDQNRSDPNAQSRFTEVGRAYDLLKDPDKRRRYDEMLNRSSFAGGAPSPSSSSGNSGFGGSSSRAGKEPTFMEKRAERARQEAEAKARAEAEARMREEAEAKARLKAQAEARAKAEAGQTESADEGTPEADEEVTPEQHEQFFEKLFGSRRSADRNRAGEAPQTERRGASKSEAPKAEQPKTESPKAEAPRSEQPRAEASQTEERTHAEEQARTAYAQDHEDAETSASPARNLFSYLVQRLTRQGPAPEKAPDHNVDAHVTIEDLLNRVNPTITLPDGKLMSVPLPDDAMDGTTVRMDGYGHKLPGMKRGDVLVTLRIRPHKWYRVDHYDLVTFHEIDIENAVLGCDATVETPDGPVRIRVPEWSGSNRTVKIEGKGLPRGNGRRGNLIVEIRVMLWDRPDQKVVDLMRSMREGLFL